MGPPQPGTARTRLALERTFLAQERTLLAWIRTALSLITFGFAVYKFFGLEHALEHTRPSNTVLGSRGFSAILIALGLLALGMATVQHQRTLQVLRAEYAQLPRSIAGWLGVLIAIVGVAALGAVLMGL